MPDPTLQQLIAEKCGTGAWAHINNPNIALAYLDLLEPSDLEEVTIMMDWEEFEEYDKETLQEELAEWYWSLTKTITPDAAMLAQGYELVDLTQCEYIEYMKSAGLPNDEILTYITVYALEEHEEEELGDLMEQFMIVALLSVWPDSIDSVTDANGDPPSEENGYLMAEDGKCFNGIFHSNEKKLPFEIIERENGTWAVKY